MSWAFSYLVAPSDLQHAKITSTPLYKVSIAKCGWIDVDLQAKSWWADSSALKVAKTKTRGKARKEVVEKW